MVLDVSTGSFGSGSDSGECRGEEGVVLVVRQEGSGALGWRQNRNSFFFFLNRNSLRVIWLLDEKSLRWGQQGQMTAREEVTAEGRTRRTSGKNMKATFK